MKKTIIFILFLSILIPNDKIKSLILPGWGELSSNNKARGKIFLYAESILAISAYAFIGIKIKIILTIIFFIIFLY